MEWAVIGAIAGSASACVAILTFWIRFATRITKAEATADEALKASEQAKRDYDLVADKLAVQTAQFSLYREQIAREYIHREVMREVEERLTQAIERLGDRLDRVLERSDHK